MASTRSVLLRMRQRLPRVLLDAENYRHLNDAPALLLAAYVRETLVTWCGTWGRRCRGGHFAPAKVLRYLFNDELLIAGTAFLFLLLRSMQLEFLAGFDIGRSPDQGEYLLVRVSRQLKAIRPGRNTSLEDVVVMADGYGGTNNDSSPRYSTDGNADYFTFARTN
jgi:hypothetical protein